MRSTSLKRTSALLLAGGLVFGLGACSDDGDDDDATGTTEGGGSIEPDDGATTDDTEAEGDAAGTGGIVIAGFAFNAVTAAGGDPVSVVNEDSTTHTVTSDDDAFEEVSLGGGESGELTAPSEPGEYPYHCEIHRNMTGVLTVP
jgi:plastocyanin